jgi:hypothetical protein
MAEPTVRTSLGLLRRALLIVLFFHEAGSAASDTWLLYPASAAADSE